MRPDIHAGLAYLAWTAYTHLSATRPPTDAEFWVVIFGSQFPDLVDKPLAWTFGVLPSGRSLGHSLLTAAILVVVLRRYLSRDRDVLVTAFAVSVVGHDLLDAIPPLQRGQPAYVRYLLWPVVDQPPYDTSRSLLDSLVGGMFHGEWGLSSLAILLVALVWIADGTPGLPIGDGE
ncbi:metal-dependent hydrolase [Haloarcula amylovorans]|uniref:metal-dependent hydrolase n=1 Tax=Haloarcula amylovorans TaxID=2562280 RepID=UPI00107600A7|nr:metal-dependent hydrolase [Halomicroarcula amylolytica]